MAIVFSCPGCGNRMQAPDSLAGQKAACPSCQSVVEVPQQFLEAEQPPSFMSPPRPPGIPPQPDITAQPPRSPFADDPEPGGGAEHPCPMCGEMIKVNALKCRFCGEIFDPTLRRAEGKSRRGRVGPGDEDMTGSDWLIAILCSGIGCIMGVVWMIQGKPKGSKMFGVSLLMQLVWGAVRFAIEASLKGP